MQKDYKIWHGKKSLINDLETRPSFHERDIWFCYMGLNVGFEQDGSGNDFMRPVIIIKKFNNEVFWAIPLTKVKYSKKKWPAQYYYEFSFIENVKSAAVLSQIKLVDAKRLARQIGIMPQNQFLEIIEKLKALLP